MNHKKIIIKCIKPLNMAIDLDFKSSPIDISNDPLILIDSSYFSFYRAYATWSWYIRAFPHAERDDWINIPEFMKMYETKFREHVSKIAKSLGVPMQSLTFVRDCHHEEIWRMKLFPQYKAHRVSCKSEAKEDTSIEKQKSNNIGPVIKYSNDNILSADAPNRLPIKIIRVPGAEADDIIAVLTSYYNKTQPNREVWIIANDSDFNQLLGQPSNKIFKIGPKFTLTRVTTEKSVHSIANGQYSIKAKILCGDKTDGIPPIFEGCSPTTAAGLINDPEKLEFILEQNPQIRAQYLLNCKLIDFNEIPEEISSRILSLIT